MANLPRKPFTPVLQLDKNSIDWKIGVLVIRKYKVPAYGNVPESLEVLLQDVDGTRVQGTIKAFNISKFEGLMNEGDIIFIQKFSVVDRPRNYPITAFPYKIVFQQDTFVGPHVNRRFGRSLFSFRSIPEIKSSAHRDDIPLFDVIGRIVTVDLKRMATEVPNKSLSFVIEDLDKNRLICVLWAPYCHQFERYRDHFMHEGRNYAVIVQLCRTKILRNGEIGVSNTFHTTKLILNQDLDEMADFLGKLPPDEAGINFEGSQISAASGMTVGEELDSAGSIFLTLDRVKKATVTQKVWVLASISEVLFERDWSYASCLKCRKKVLNKDDKVFCDNCQDYVVGNTRYKVFVNVVDGTTSAVFLLWDDAAKELIGKDAAAVTEKMMLDNFANDETVSQPGKIDQPKDVDAITGMEALFKIAIEQKHLDGRDSVYAVDKICTDRYHLAKHRQTSHLPIGMPGGHGQGNQGESSWDGSDPSDDSGGEFDSPDSKGGKRKLGQVFAVDEDADGTPSISSTKVKVAVKLEKDAGAGPKASSSQK